MSKIFVTGRGGQLASEFEYIFSKNDDWVFLSINDLDISDENSVNSFFEKKNPKFIINCAAYTSVDLAEDEIDLAYLVNDIGVYNLTKICKKKKARLIHYSTDYVFDGKSSSPYKEESTTKPSTIYGLSKLAGEFRILGSEIESIIIRTSWVYSNYGNNFVKSMLKMADKKSELSIVCDQIGSPTYARDLARHTICIIDNSSYKWSQGDIFHYSNKGFCSWFDFANKIFEYSNIDIELKPIPSRDFPSKVNRPSYSLLSKEKFENTFDLKINDWEVSLKEMLKLI